MSLLIPGAAATSSALSAERTRLEVASLNIANAGTTRGVDGQPYRRQQVVFETLLESAGGAAQPVPVGVRVARIVPDASPLPRIHQPGHPDADGDGMVTLPNVQVAEEMADILTASRAYEANTQVLLSARQMVTQVLRIGR